MDPLTLVDLTRTLVDIDSTTGIEGDCGRWLAAYLRARGWRVEEQPVTDTRFNVLATLDPPRKQEAIQMLKVAGFLFGYMVANKH